MKKIVTLLTLTLGAVAFATAAVAEENENELPRESRPRRASGSMVVKARPGSLPRDADMFAPAAVPVERRHYTWTPEFMANARAEAYVDASVPAGFRLGGNVGTPEQPMSPRAPTRNITFEGLNIATSGYLGFRAFPPDTIVSVSPTKILQGTNVALRLTTRTGVEIDARPLNSFFGFSGDTLLFDPKVYFDRLSERFYVVALEQSEQPQRSGIWVAISKSDDPTMLSAPDEFCTYRFNGKIAGSWADYPLLGINEEWLAVAVNTFGFNGGPFRQVQIYTLPVAQVTDNADGCPTLGVKRFTPKTDAAGFIAFNIHPAQHYTTNNLEGSPLFLVSSSFALPTADYTLWRIRTTDAGQPQITKQTIPGDFAYNIPPLAPQKDGLPLDTGDIRVTQAAFRDGKLWAVHGTSCAVGALPNESCVRAIEITPTDDTASITFSETFGQPNTFLFWPGVAINASGDVVLAFQRARENARLDMVFNGKREAAAHFDSLRALRVSNCPLDNVPDGSSVNRTGDYVGIQTDPLDDHAFWIAGEYAGTVNQETGCNWKTRIGRVQYN